jgi:radical SAM superfamily enzyme YgiQ (UPF0313 family)
MKNKAFTLIGHPGETYEDVQKTKKWIIENKPDGFDISILMPYPGSKLYDHSKPSSKYGGFDREWKGLFFKRIDFSKENSFYKGKPGEYTCHCRTEDLSEKDILQLRVEIEDCLKK